MANTNLKELKELIDLVSEKGFAEFEFERQGFRLRIVRFKEPSADAAPLPGPTSTTAAAANDVSFEAYSPARPSAPIDVASATAQSAVQAAEQREAALRIIKSPIVGTFYRSASPTAEPFVSIGDFVEPESVVCIIEAMKLMNEIQAEISGEVVKVLVENGQPVEYGQPLFGVKN